MTNNEIFQSALRADGDLAGVFEFDGETGYFYLYKENAPPNQKVIDTIHVITGSPDFAEQDVTIRWADNENLVGLHIRSKLWAAFDCREGAKYGGNYQMGGTPAIPETILRMFQEKDKI